MDQLVELLQQIQDLAGLGIDALKEAAGGGKPAPGTGGEPAPAKGGAPMEGSAPEEDQGPPPGAGR